MNKPLHNATLAHAELSVNRDFVRPLGGGVRSMKPLAGGKGVGEATSRHAQNEMSQVTLTKGKRIFSIGELTDNKLLKQDFSVAAPLNSYFEIIHRQRVCFEGSAMRICLLPGRI